MEMKKKTKKQDTHDTPRWNESPNDKMKTKHQRKSNKSFPHPLVRTDYADQPPIKIKIKSYETGEYKKSKMPHYLRWRFLYNAVKGRESKTTGDMRRESQADKTTSSSRSSERERKASLRKAS